VTNEPGQVATFTVRVPGGARGTVVAAEIENLILNTEGAEQVGPTTFEPFVTVADTLKTVAREDDLPVAALVKMDEIDLCNVGFGEIGIFEIKVALGEIDLSLLDKRQTRTLQSLPLEDHERAMLRTLGFNLEMRLVDVPAEMLWRGNAVLEGVRFLYSLIGMLPTRPTPEPV
jgi:hypothetical protein